MLITCTPGRTVATQSGKTDCVVIGRLTVARRFGGRTTRRLGPLDVEGRLAVCLRAATTPCTISAPTPLRSEQSGGSPDARPVSTGCNSTTAHRRLHGRRRAAPDARWHPGWRRCRGRRPVPRSSSLPQAVTVIAAGRRPMPCRGERVARLADRPPAGGPKRTGVPSLPHAARSCRLTYPPRGPQGAVCVVARVIPAVRMIGSSAVPPVMPAPGSSARGQALAGIHDFLCWDEGNRVGAPLAERPSHTTGRTDRVSRRFPTRFSAAFCCRVKARS